MKPLDPDRLAEAMIGGTRKYVDAVLGPVLERLAAAEARAEAAEARIAALVAAAVAAIELPAPVPGRSVTVEDVRPLIEETAARLVGEAVRGLPPARDGVGFAEAVIDRDGALVLTRTDGTTLALGRVVGESAAPDMDLVARMVKEAVAATVAALPPARDGADGKDADLEAVAGLVQASVAEAVAAIAPPAPPDLSRFATKDEMAALERGLQGAVRSHAEDGARIDALAERVERVNDGIAPLVDAVVNRVVAALPPAKDGAPGAPGKLPVAKAWIDVVHYEGDVRTHKGALWQATSDTGREPGHGDWICLAARGEDGKAADEIAVRGTYDPEAQYRRLDIVALNGGAFIARQDDPGPCPGEGWQVIAMRGKPGPPGETRKGDPGLRGEPGPPVAALSVDGDGLLTLTNADGSAVTCDLYPLLSKIGSA